MTTPPSRRRAITIWRWMPPAGPGITPETRHRLSASFSIGSCLSTVHSVKVFGMRASLARSRGGGGARVEPIGELLHLGGAVGALDRGLAHAARQLELV